MSSQKVTYLEDEHKRRIVHLIYQRYARSCGLLLLVHLLNLRITLRSSIPYTDVYNLVFRCLRKDYRVLRLHARFQIFYDTTGRVCNSPQPTSGASVRVSDCPDLGRLLASVAMGCCLR